jgi:hypothetical protein
LHKLDEPEKAIEQAEAALKVYEQIGHPNAAKEGNQLESDKSTCIKLGYIAVANNQA